MNEYTVSASSSSMLKDKWPCVGFGSTPETTGLPRLILLAYLVPKQTRPGRVSPTMSRVGRLRGVVSMLSRTGTSSAARTGLCDLTASQPCTGCEKSCSFHACALPIATGACTLAANHAKHRSSNSVVRASYRFTHKRIAEWLCGKQPTPGSAYLSSSTAAK